MTANPPYLDACASIVFEAARRTRDAFDWPRDLRDAVEQRIASDAMLCGYRFSD